jgi:hypothetical protein
MPSKGTLVVRRVGLIEGAPLSYTLAGEPERMMPWGLNFFISSREQLKGRISEYTLHSLTLRAISWVYWEPQSRIRIFPW